MVCSIPLILVSCLFSSFLATPGGHVPGPARVSFSHTPSASDRFAPDAADTDILGAACSCSAECPAEFSPERLSAGDLLSAWAYLAFRHDQRRPGGAGAPVSSQPHTGLGLPLLC